MLPYVPEQEQGLAAEGSSTPPRAGASEVTRPNVAAGYRDVADLRLHIWAPITMPLDCCSRKHNIANLRRRLFEAASTSTYQFHPFWSKSPVFRGPDTSASCLVQESDHEQHVMTSMPGPHDASSLGPRKRNSNPPCALRGRARQRSKIKIYRDPRITDVAEGQKGHICTAAVLG
jgi:hypothetical protein